MENKLIMLRPWAIKRGALQTLSAYFEQPHNSDGDETEPEAAPSAGPAFNKNYQTVGAMQVVDGIARIQIYGLIEKRPSPIRFFIQTTSVQEIVGSLKAALSSDKVKKIVLDIDSPGGGVDGVAELSNLIYASRKKKPIIAYSDGEMLSAAYWIGSAAEKIYATIGATIGDIGVYTLARDFSVRDHNQGVRTALIKAGEFKAAGHPSVPLTDDGRSELQREVDTFYSLFVEAVSRNRGIALDRAQALANGRSFLAKKALELGLINGIQSLESFTSEAMAAEENILAATPIKTADDLRAQFPALVAGIEAAAKVQIRMELTGDENFKIKSAVFDERERVRALFRLAYPGQQNLIRDLVSNGATPDQARIKFDEEATPEQRAEREWRTNPAIRQEFTSAEVYLAYSKAVKDGRARVFHGR